MTLIFTSSKIKIPVYSSGDNSSLIESYRSDYSIYLTAQIATTCKAGYEHRKYELILDLCSECSEGYYNTYPNMECLKCPDASWYCKKNIILLKSGYWMSSSSSLQILDCNSLRNSCKGD